MILLEKINMLNSFLKTLEHVCNIHAISSAATFYFKNNCSICNYGSFRRHFSFNFPEKCLKIIQFCPFWRSIHKEYSLVACRLSQFISPMVAFLLPFHLVKIKDRVDLEINKMNLGDVWDTSETCLSRRGIICYCINMENLYFCSLILSSYYAT